ncbi:three component ABC system middle component [Clostridium perfringens]|uniref:three component ABC system middle component n=1 Tax=Clostridium perfringens TaxID=1502 RepID=UPI0039EC9F39
MSIRNIKILSMNSHFYALLFRGFLSGYNKPCEIRTLFMALPILLYSDSRKKLISANKTSRMESLFNKPKDLENNEKNSGKSDLAGYIKRFEDVKGLSKKAIIILYSQENIRLEGNKIFLISDPISHLNYKGEIKSWIRAAYYLGIIFAKTNEDHLNYFLGVDRI